VEKPLTFEPMPDLPADWRTMPASDPRWDRFRHDARERSNLWMRTLEQGTLVHYHHGCFVWVRCEVVMHPLRVPSAVTHDASVPSLVPLAMVGPGWGAAHAASLERWEYKIRVGESFQPCARNVHESPYWPDPDSEDPALMAVFVP